MKRLITYLEDELAAAFEKAGYDRKYARVTVANRPDLCEFQCSGAMAAAKEYHKAPFMIADDILAALPEEREAIGTAEVAKPGFINLRVAEAFLGKYLTAIAEDGALSIPQEDPQTILIDYGGPNVAKPLHIGHLRSAVIGECVKRLGRALGHKVIGDVHLGDWGLQMGLLIAALEEESPEMPYFDEAFDGEYPAEAPFTISHLEELYPAASARSKEDEAFREKAMAATHSLQEGRRGYRALWEKIMEISIADLKKNYEALDVHFDLWKGESDVQPYIPGMVEEMRTSGIAYEDQGALVVDVAEESDSKTIPPCIILKSDGAALYSTTDLATLIEREKLYDPDRIIYVVDKRQDMHFLQVFRTAKKAGIVKPNLKLNFLGFGTMNGKDGKPFKTREGGVMRLEYLIRDINEEMEKKILDNKNVRVEDAKATAAIVALAALKYGDLSNQATKDYIFDIDKFTSFEGNTGPYILYTIVRMKSILSRFAEESGCTEEEARALAKTAILPPAGEAEKHLMLALADFGAVVADAFEELAPHRLCQFLYELANALNTFYHETKILSEPDEEKKRSYIGLLALVTAVMEKGIGILGFDAPERM